MEVPIATFPCLGRNWPVGGGGYHRLLPGFVSRYFAKNIMASAPFTFYCHPYELDFLEFREIAIKIPLHVRVYQGLGRRWFGQRFKLFLHRFGGRRVQDLFSSNAWPQFDLAPFMRPPETLVAYSR